MKCQECGLVCKNRSFYLLHITTHQQDAESSDGSESSRLNSPTSECEPPHEVYSGLPSPVTEEQAQVAADVEAILGEMKSESDYSMVDDSYADPLWSPGSQINELQKEEESPDSNVKTTTLTEDQTTSKKLSVKKGLDAVRKDIEIWKEKLKKARKEQNHNKARRISKKIGKKRKLLTSTDEEGCEYLSGTQYGDDDDAEEATSLLQYDNRKESTYVPEYSDREESTSLPQCVDRVEFIQPDNQPTLKSKRKKNFCIHCKRLVSRLTDHLVNSHPETPESIQLKEVTGSAAEKRIKKTKITEPLRKLWNSVYNKDKPVELVIPVKATVSQKKKVGTVICVHCQGYYRRDKLSVHLKTCASYAMSNVDEEDKDSNAIPALKQHSLPHIHSNIKSLVCKEFVNEILKGVHVDHVIEEAIRDPLIMKFGNDFHQSRREFASRSYVIREIRDVTRLYMEMKKKCPEINSFEECFNPKHFDTMVESALVMAGYDQESGSINVPSIAYRLSQPIKAVADTVKNKRLNDLYKGSDGDRSGIEMINDFLDLINSEWKNKIGRICRKSQKLARVVKEDKVALQKDIVKFACYIESMYRKTISKLKTNSDKASTYNLLMHLLVSHIMLLVRRRPVDFKSAKLRHYDNIDKHDDLVSMANMKDFTESDITTCKRFHIFYVPGKNLQIVPMVLTPLMKRVMDTLIEERTNVGITNDTLFSLANNKNIKPNESLKAMAEKVNLEKPAHMTGNGLRHQAATFSRLHSTHPQYQDYLASVLGHNLFTHKKHYDLPTSIIQKMMVCPILHDIMTGKNQPTTTSTTDMEISTETPLSSTDYSMVRPTTSRASNVTPLKEVTETPLSSTDYSMVRPTTSREKNVTPLKEVSDDSDESLNMGQETTTREKKSKKRWSEAEQKIVFQEFGRKILQKVIPKRKEVVDFYEKNIHILCNRSVAQVELFIRNHVKRQQLNVTPKVKRFLKLNH